MRYHYTPGNNPPAGEVYHLGYSYCDRCTLYRKGDRVLAVVQRRFNPELKCVWLGPLDPQLAADIYAAEGFQNYFDKNSREENSEKYPLTEVRSVMWALRMKPLKKEDWEEIWRL